MRLVWTCRHHLFLIAAEMCSGHRSRRHASRRLAATISWQRPERGICTDFVLFWTFKCFVVLT